MNPAQLLQIITLMFGKCFDHHILVLMVLLLLNEAHHQARIVHERPANRRRNRFYALQEMEEMTELHLKRIFRMSKFAFNQSLTKLEDYYNGSKDESAAENSSGEIVNKQKMNVIKLCYIRLNNIFENEISMHTPQANRRKFH